MKIEFEHHWGGKDTWYLKLERWAKKTMREVDLQATNIVQEWENNDRTNHRYIMERGVFGDEGWSIEISNRTFGERTEITIPKLDPRSDARQLEKDERDQGS